ncbi:MAG: hypothetical protein KDI06_09055 [Calditrichaeota bacterium]|nr:hypothetical protein [Calditrichota bacterium]HQU71177.1 hypothetical protein [Calditrichia bacterium]
MNTTVKNILAVFAGVVVGMVVNMGIVTMSGAVIAPPEGVDVTDMESLKASIHLFEPKHFIMPFLAHALGTLAGAFVAAKMAASHKISFAMGIGVFFLLGGIANIFMLGGPLWFTVLDIAGAYLPMGWLGGKLAS